MIVLNVHLLVETSASSQFSLECCFLMRIFKNNRYPSNQLPRHPQNYDSAPPTVCNSNDNSNYSNNSNDSAVIVITVIVLTLWRFVLNNLSTEEAIGILTNCLFA